MRAPRGTTACDNFRLRCARPQRHPSKREISCRMSESLVSICPRYHPGIKWHRRVSRLLARQMIVRLGNECKPSNLPQGAGSVTFWSMPQTQHGVSRMFQPSPPSPSMWPQHVLSLSVSLAVRTWHGLGMQHRLRRLLSTGGQLVLRICAEPSAGTCRQGGRDRAAEEQLPRLYRGLVRGAVPSAPGLLVAVFRFPVAAPTTSISPHDPLSAQSGIVAARMCKYALPHHADAHLTPLACSLV